MKTIRNASGAQAALAEYTDQTFTVSCQFCGEMAFTHPSRGADADQRDRFDAVASFYKHGWRVTTESNLSRTLRPTCPNCFEKYKPYKNYAPKDKEA